MELKRPEMQEKPTLKLTHKFIGRDGIIRTVEEKVLNEHHLSVSVNGLQNISFVCLPQFLPELVIGHMAAEGYIRSAEDVERLCFNAEGTEAELVLKSAPSCREMVCLPPVEWRSEWVFALADRFAQGMPIHDETFATHSCFLAQGENCLFQCEDIGRHNAVDKAVGYAILSASPLSACLIYSSGRTPTDMAQKAICAGIPLFASKGAPTAPAVELARKHGLTLVCAARRDRMKLYSGSEPR